MRSAAVRVGLALFAVYVTLTCGFDVSEGRDDAELARHWVRSGRLAMDAPLNPNWVRGPDGRYYSAHEAGNPVAMIPVVVLADRIAGTAAPWLPSLEPALIAGAVLPLLAAAYVALTAAAFCVCLLVMFGMPVQLSVVLTLVLGLTTILAPYSRMLYDGVLGGALIAWGLACAAIATRAHSAAAAAAAGALTGAAFATRQPLILLALPIVGHLTFDTRSSERVRLLVAFSLGLAPAVLWQAWYNAVRTGAPHVPAVAMAQFDNVNAAGNIAEGLAGLLLSPGKSMLLFSPLLVLAPIGWKRLHERVPGFAWGLMAGILTYLLVHAGIRNWSGEWGWGPRYTVPLTMPLMLAAALAVQSAIAHRGWPRRAVYVLAIAGGFVQLVALATNWHYHASWLATNLLYDRAAIEWSLSRGQLAEMTRVFIQNLARTAGSGVEPEVVAAASPLTAVTGNGINVWPATAIAAGLPPALVVAIALAMVSGAAGAVWWALRAEGARVRS